jgi:hypothetical protein
MAHDIAFRAQAAGGQVRPGGLLIVTVINLVLWSVLVALIVHAV